MRHVLGDEDIHKRTTRTRHAEVVDDLKNIRRVLIRREYDLEGEEVLAGDL